MPNTLRFYRWQPSAVSVGKNQNPENEVYLDACKQLGVDVVRRISGGGTVYHDFEGEVTYSVVAKTADFGTGDITTVYFKIYEAITDALRLLGVPADFSSGDAKNCPNLTVNGKKISGSSQTITRGVVLQHGTILAKCGFAKNVHAPKTKKRQLHPSRRHRQTQNHQHPKRTGSHKLCLKQSPTHWHRALRQF